VTTLLALLGVATSVQAASFRKSWDPFFNSEFFADTGINLGWRGEAVIFVSDSCLLTSDVQVFAGPPIGTSIACNGEARLESYELTFYDFDTNAVLGFNSGIAPGLEPVTAVSFDASGIANGVSLIEGISAGSFTFGTETLSFEAFLSFNLLNETSLTLFDNNCPLDPQAVEKPTCDYQSQFPPDVTWSLLPPSQVPTPATLALVGIGLAGLGWSRRKKL
jgi:hypothetical protein